MITVTENALNKLKEVLLDGDTLSKLRIYVTGGGCTGMQYGFSIETESNEDDTSVNCGGVEILIDSVSSQYLEGSEVDYSSNLTSSSFSVKNPNATAKCGCGSSFAV